MTLRTLLVSSLLLSGCTGGITNPRFDDTGVDDTGLTDDTGATDDTGTTDSGDTGTDSGDSGDTGNTDTGSSGFSCPANDDNETNDDAASATDLAADTVDHGMICGDEELDYFAIQAPAGCLGTATLSFDSDAADIDLGVFDADENLLDLSFEGVDEEEVQWFNRSEVSEEYLLVVAGYLGTTEYTLEFGCTAATCDNEDDFEPDAPETPNTLGADTTIDASICYGDSDWFEIALDAGCTAELDLDFTHATGDLDLYLYDAEGTLEDYSETESDDEALAFTNTGAATTMIVEVYGFDLADNDYALTYTQICDGTCDTGADDIPSGATALAVGGSVSDEICADDEDWYAITLPDGCATDAVLTHEYDDGDLDLYLLASDGATDLEYAVFGEDVERIYYGNDSGSAMSLYLQVLGYTEEGESPTENTYSLAYDTICACPEDAQGGTNTLPNSAHPLTLDATYTGGLCGGDNPQDYFVFTGSAGCTVDVMLAFLGYTDSLLDLTDVLNDLDMFMYEGDDEVAYSDQSYTSSEYMSYDVGDTDETLYLRVLGYLVDGPRGAAYDLEVTQSCP